MDRHGYNIENAENLPPTATTTTVAADNDVTRSRSEQAQRLLLKMDFTIVPMLACSFFIAYLVFARIPFSIVAFLRDLVRE